MTKVKITLRNRQLFDYSWHAIIIIACDFNHLVDSSDRLDIDNKTKSFDHRFSGMKYQSNLNEIDKSEQKSQADSSSKVFEWPSKDEPHAHSK